MNSSDLRKMMPFHPWQTPRWRNLDYLWRMYHARHYDFLPYMFCQEKNDRDEYVPLNQRKPSVRYRLPRIVVKKSVSMLFSGRNWPQVTSDDQDLTNWLDVFYRRHHFPVFCSRVATMGSIGSVVPMFRYDPSTKVLTLDVWNARDCTPLFDPSGILRKITLKYLTSKENLEIIGLPVDPKLPAGKEMWYRRELDAEADVTYTPTPSEDWDESDPEVAAKIRPVAEHSYNHGLGFIPACWVRNLPTEDFDDATIDGTSTFDCIADFVLEMDYLLSQGGRGLRYNSDPQLFWKDPIAKPDGSGSLSGFGGIGGPLGPTSRSTSRTLIGGADADAKLLEMSGNGQKVMLEWVRELRNLALEVVRASRKDPQKSLSNAASGKLAEILDEDVINLGAELRNSYGSEFLIEFTTKIVLALQHYEVRDPIIQGVTPEELKSIMLIWGPWFEPTSADHMQLQQALAAAVVDGRMDVQSARRITYADFGMAMPKTVDWVRNARIISANERSKNAWRLDIAAITAGMAADRAGAVAASRPAPAAGKNADGTPKAAPKPKAIPPPPPIEDFLIDPLANLDELGDMTGEDDAGDGEGPTNPLIDIVTEEVRRDAVGLDAGGVDEESAGPGIDGADGGGSSGDGLERGHVSDLLDVSDIAGMRYRH